MNLAEKAAEVMWREDDASRALGMTLDAVRLGYARMTMQVKKNMANGQKVCHGGFIFTLADSAFGFACNTHNQRAVSASCSIGYLAPAFVDDQKGETVALFRGHSATVKGTWV